MRTLRRIWRRLAALRERSRLRDELDDEMRAHVALIADELVARGLDPAEAEREARRRFGNALAVRERALDSWSFPRLEGVLRDARLGLRGIRRAPAFAGVVLITLALGIGATTALFSVVYGSLLRPLPYPEAERIVWLGESAGEAQGISVTWGNLRQWQQDARTLAHVTGYVRGLERTLTGVGEARVAAGWLVSPSFFALAGWSAATGRVLTAGDDLPEATRVLVVSHAFWQGPLGADPAVVGRVLQLDGEPWEVVGVLPPGAEPWESGVDFFAPIGPFFSDAEPRSRHGSIRALARRAPGVELEQVGAELDAILARLAESDPGPEDDHRAWVVPLREVVQGDAGRPLWWLLGAVGLVLLLASANVASLLLGRGVLRRREMAIRAALGAGRRRLARQLLTETMVLTGLGGAAGVLLAWMGLSGVRALLAQRLPASALPALDLPVLGFAAAVTVLVGLLAGAAPVLSERLEVATRLKDGASGSGSGRSGQALRGALVAGEVAVTVVLAVAAALLLRSLLAASREGPGFPTAGLVALELRLPSARYPDGEARARFFEAVLDRLEAMPGVTAASALGCPPTWGNCGDWWYSVAGRPAPAEDEVPLARLDVAFPGAFTTLGLPLRAGRALDDRDRAGPPVVVVNEALARRWWSSPSEAVGQALKVGGPAQEGPTAQIVGVVADARQDGPDVPAEPQFWLPYAQQSRSRMVVVIRAAEAGAPGLPALRAQVGAVDPALAVWSLRPFTDVVGARLEARRTGTRLLGLFAALAVALAGIGVYGVLQQWVATRRGEIALRMALGAEPREILRWVGRHAALLVGTGLVVGVPAAWSVSRALRGLLYGVSPYDPLAVGAAAAGVVVLAAAAAGLPLLRAARVDAAQELVRR